MRRVLASILALAPLASVASCASNHYDDVVRIAASKHPRSCAEPYKVAALSRWGFRVDACEGTLFYRCWSQRKSMGRTQCCSLVPDEDSATSVVTASDTGGLRSTCVEFAD